ncbi:tyrosine--tRNA ligase, partial [Patescibacteria group bacterium]|nr:tyrosine--tRNA ligase [Patescibacteria group bacterium]
EVMNNARLYKKQASLFLNFKGSNKAELKYNGKWLDRMNFADVINLSSQVTVQRMLDRDLFRRRLDAGIPIYIHEFMYPLMQGYDSVAMQVDGEVGGNDQTFNMLVGRDLLKNQDKPKEKFVIPMKLLVDSNGEKMGKTTGNMLSLLDTADEMFKKVMTWSDDVMMLGFELLTDLPLDQVETRIKAGENPRDIKFDLAHAIVTRVYGEKEAEAAHAAWINDVQEDNQPSDIPTIELKADIVETLAAGTSDSKSQIRRSLSEGAVKVNGNKVDEQYALASGDTIQIGKKRWFQIK